MEGDEHASRAEDVQMNGPVNPINEGETDEEGEDIEMGKNISDDSSEEEEEDEEAERKVREGFIVDEDEDEEDEEDEEERRRRKKRRKHKHRHRKLESGFHCYFFYPYVNLSG